MVASFGLPSFLRPGRVTDLGDSAGDCLTFLITFDRGQVRAVPVNQRLTKAEAAKLLRTTEDGIAYLTRKRSLKPLGHPDGTKQKLFSAVELLALMSNRSWLSKITDELYQYTEEKNSSQNKRKKQR